MSLFIWNFQWVIIFFPNIINETSKFTPVSGGIASIGALTLSYPTDLLRRRM